MACYHLWLRAPSASYTLAQAAMRYPRFLALLRLHPRTPLVPTPEINLAWNTHRLSPSQYRGAATGLCRQLLDEIAGPARKVLAEDWKTTSRLWKAHWGDDYGMCLCWDCQGLAAELEQWLTTPWTGNMNDIVEKIRTDVEFYRVVEIARRKGNRLPVRSMSG